jgi:outer membrane autotransporter protein
MPVSADYQLVLDNLNNPASNAIYSEAPGAGYAVTDGFTDRVLALSDAQLDAIRCGTASGNAGRGMRSWGQLFGMATHQGDRDGLFGFDTHGGGGAVGMDSANVLQNAIIGASLGIARSDVDARDPTMADTTIKSLQMTVYADYDLGNHAFLRGFAGYTHSRNDTQRNDFGTIDVGSYGANEFSTLLKAGKTFRRDHMMFTPSMMGRWVHYNPEDYTETGGSALHVTQQSVDSVEIGPAVDVTWLVKMESGAWFVPSAHAGYRFDLANESITTVYSPLGCCASTGTSPAPGRSRFNLGGSLTWYSTESWEFKAGYDFDTRQDAVGHTGLLRGTLRY